MADEIGKAFQKVGGTAGALNLEFEKVASWIAIISSRTRESSERIGNAVKSILARLQQLREKGYAESEDGNLTDVNMVSKALAKANIDLMDKQTGQFRDFGIVIDELGAKWKTLDKNLQAHLATTIAGVYQQSRFLTLMDGYSESVDLYEKSLNAAGTATEKFAIYQESLNAKLDKFRSTLEGLYDTIINSEALKSLITTGTNLIEVIDNVIKQFGALNTIIYIAINALVIFRGKAIVSAIAGITSLNIALLSLLTNPVVLLVAAIGTITAGLIGWSNEQQKLKQKIEETKQATESFSNSFIEFNKSLDPQKVEDMASALTKLQDAINYKDKVEEIKKLEKEIANLQEQIDNPDQRKGTLYSTQQSLGRKSNRLNYLREEISEVQKMEKELQDSRIKSNLEEARKENEILNDKLLNNKDFYKNVILGNKDLASQLQQLYGQDFNNWQSLNDLKQRSDEFLIRTLGASWQRYYGTQANAFKAIQDKAKVFEAKAKLAGTLFGKDKEKEMLSSTYGSEYFGLSLQASQAEVLAKAFGEVGKSASTFGSTFTPGGSDKDRNIQDTTSALINQIQAQSVLLSQKEKLIQQELQYASKTKDTNTQIKLNADLIELQKQKVNSLLDANKKLHAEADKIRASTSFDTKGWINSSGELTVEYINQYNRASKEQQEEMDRVSSALQKLGNQYMSNVRSVDEFRYSIQNLTLELSDLREQMADELINIYKELYKKNYDILLQAIEDEMDILEKSHKEKMDYYDSELDKLKDAYDARLKLLDLEKDSEDYNRELNKLQKKRQEIESKKNILSVDDTEFAKKQRKDLQEELDKIDEQIADLQRNRERDLIKESLKDQYDATKKELEMQKDKARYVVNINGKMVDGTITEIKELVDEERKILKRAYDNFMNDEIAWTQMKTDIINGHFTGISNGLNGLQNSFSTHMKTIGDVIYANLIKKLEDAKALIGQLGGTTSPSPTPGGSTGGSSGGSSGGGGTTPTNNATATLPDGSTVGININDQGKTTTPGLSMGTVVHTNSGDYVIIGINSDGSYQSAKLPEPYTPGTSSGGSYNDDDDSYSGGGSSTSAPSTGTSTGTSTSTPSPTPTPVPSQPSAPTVDDDKEAEIERIMIEQGVAEDIAGLMYGSNVSAGYKMYHKGGIIGNSGSKVSELLNNLLNNDADEVTIRALRGEVFSPAETNMSRYLVPNLQKLIGSMQFAQPAMAGGNTEVNYNLSLNIENLNGDKNAGKQVWNTLVTNLKKMGKDL